MPTMKKHASFQGKRFFPLLRRTKSCELSLHEMAAYSYLVHRAHFRAGATLAELHRLTSLDRDRTLPQIRDRLAELGLVEMRDGKLFALQPTGRTREWFHWRKTKATDWHDQFQFIQFYPLSEAGRRRLTLAQCCLLWLLYSFATKRITKDLCNKGLATMLGINRKTVAEGLKVLEELRLIDILPSNRRKAFFAVALRPPTPEHLELFLDDGSNEDEYGIEAYLASADERSEGTAETKVKTQPARKLSELWKLPERLAGRDPLVAERIPKLLDRNAELMRAANYSDVEITEYWKLVEKETDKTRYPLGAFCLAIGGFESFFKGTEQMHNKNARSGKFKYARNCSGLLKTRMPQKIKEIADIFNYTDDWETHLYTIGAMCKA